MAQKFAAPRSQRSPPKLKKEDQTLRPAEDPDAWIASAKAALGVSDSELIQALVSQAAASSRGQGADPQAVNATLAAVTGIKPRDELEVMLATQMVAVHNLAMEMTQRTLLGDQTFDGVNAGVNRVAKLMRTFTSQVEALQRYRVGGKQTVTVQHVNVNDGGRAVVGSITKGGGGDG